MSKNWTDLWKRQVTREKSSRAAWHGSPLPGGSQHHMLNPFKSQFRNLTIDTVLEYSAERVAFDGASYASLEEDFLPATSLQHRVAGAPI
jgi:hypothetical protein